MMTEKDLGINTGKGKVNLSPILLALLFFIMLGAACFVKLHNNDIFWHLSVGREIIQSGHITFPNIFNSTTDMRTYDNIEWAFEVPAYLLAALDPENLTWLIVLRVVCMTAVFTILWRLARRLGVHPALIAIMLTLSFLSLSFRLYVRTFLVTYIMLAALAWLLTINQRREKPDKKLLWIIPLLMMIWTNMHPLCLMGLFAIGAAWLASGIDWLTGKKDGTMFKFHTLLGTLSTLATLISPYPGKYIVRIYWALTHYTKLLVVSEEVRPGFILHWEFYLLAGICLLLLPFAIAKRRYFEGILFIGFAVLAVRNVRFIGAFSILCMPLVFTMLSHKTVTEYAQKKSVRLAVMILAVVVVVSGFGNFIDSGPAWGRGVNCAKLPCDSVEFIRTHFPDRPLYNPLGDGGYIIWTSYPVLKPFWDGRFEAQKHLFEGLPRSGFPEFLAANNINVALLPLKPETADKNHMFIEKEIIAERVNWALVHFDRTSMVFVRRTPETIGLVQSLEYTILQPWKNNLGIPRNPSEETMALALKEANRAFSNLPDDPYCMWIAGAVNKMAGRLDDARRILETCIEKDFRTSSCHDMLGLVELKSGDPDKARWHLSRALAYGPDSISTLNNLAAAYISLGEMRKAKSTLYRALNLDRNSKLTNYNLAIVYDELGDTEKAARHKAIAER